MRLLGAGVLRYCLGSLAHCMFCQFTRKKQTDWSLYFSGRNGLCLVVLTQSGSFTCNSLEQIVNEGVHNGHSLCGNTNVRMDLLENTVDVSSVGFFPCSSSLLDFSSPLATLLWAALFRTCFFGTSCHISISSKVCLMVVYSKLSEMRRFCILASIYTLCMDRKYRIEKRGSKFIMWSQCSVCIVK